MPVRDHFHPPISEAAGWEEIHTQWIANLTRNLNREWLPEGYRAAPERSFGPEIQVDVGVVREPQAVYAAHLGREERLSSYEVPQPDATVAGAVSPHARVVIGNASGRLVAVVELVSPGNKDDAPARNAFTGKLESYLRAGVSVAMVDLVTNRRHNLHNHWAGLYGGKGTPRFTEEDSGSLYAAAYHPYVEVREGKENPRLDLWLRPVRLGAELPVLPLFIERRLAVPLELEKTYTETCADLRLPAAA